jgi:2-aminoadipate transaminase
VAFVPGEQAYLDGRGRNAMRLNFSNQDEESIREGIRRIGKVIQEQVALYGTLTGQEPPTPPARGALQPEADSGEGGRVVSFPERRRSAGGS